MSDTIHKKLGILVGGGPAPGINGVIHSATIEAVNNDCEVLGIYDGFKHLMEGKLVVEELTINDVSRIHLNGGSILRTSRANPTKSAAALAQCGRTLLKANIGYLLAIGGDDTAYSAYRVARYAQEELGADIQVAHAPKTIDNDLPLPEDICTFGYETARELGTRLVMNLMEEGLTGFRWFFVVTMGRKAGHLALGIGKSSGATITLIPEEWQGRPIRLQEVADILVTTLIRRFVDDKPYGVALVAEGVMAQMAHEDLHELEYVERDEHGHIRLAEINFADILKRVVQMQLDKLGIKLSITSKDLGYELRCAAPVAFDIDYTRSLGEAAMEFLLAGGTNATITIQGNQVVPIPFSQMMDPETGRTEVRQVNVNSFRYRSAYKFMIRLKPEDATNVALLSRMADKTNLSLEEFKQRYGYLINIAPQPF
ncbi:MAG: diphosphate--fructose-6-phosphate 1-phosphotransferase [Chloroflexota bacterium]|nr:diphosphate--fructose-6-phosphate 1-phosphotransferase [Chloroflexota bacterium]